MTTDADDLAKLAASKATVQQQMLAIQQETAKQLADMQQKFNDMEKELQDRKARARTLKIMVDAFDRTVNTVTLEQLPVLSVPKGDMLIAQGQFHKLLWEWKEAGAATVFTFTDLVDHSQLGKSAPDFLKTILGSQWKTLFPEEPIPAAFVPKQAALLALASLERLKQHWIDSEKADEIKSAGAASFALLAGEAKKRKAELYDIDMA